MHPNRIHLQSFVRIIKSKPVGKYLRIYKSGYDKYQQIHPKSKKKKKTTNHDSWLLLLTIWVPNSKSSILAMIAM
jgi:hypothetical protein